MLSKHKNAVTNEINAKVFLGKGEFLFFLMNEWGWHISFNRNDLRGREEIKKIFNEFHKVNGTFSNNMCLLDMGSTQ